jgi:hypothetical protein
LDAVILDNDVSRAWIFYVSVAPPFSGYPIVTATPDVLAARV